MKAVVYRGPFDVSVETVPDPRVEQASDAVIRITTTNICGSDLHVYEGRTAVEGGTVLCHENMGVVEEVGPGVDRIRVGDRVSVPFNENDFAMLSDIFPTGWHGTELAGVRAGDRVAVFGAGPVGLMAAHGALIRGASDVFVVDKERDRLDLAGSIGATPVDLSEGDPVEQILDSTDGMGVERGVEAVGYQAHDAAGQEHPELVLDNLVAVVRSTGGIGVVGVYPAQDPGAATEGARQGRIGFEYGTFFTKGQQMGTGQAPVKRYNRRLRDLILAGRATPSFLVSHELTLDQAAEGYRHFDNREDGWTKVLLHPAA